MSKY
jgi:hypothetical protein